MINPARKKTLRVALGLFALAVLFGSGWQGEAQDKAPDKAPEKAPARLSVKASIDSECQSHPGTFTVPTGKSAHDFKSGGLEPGSACHEEGAPENVGFAIRDQAGKPVYMWSKYKDQKPYEKGGPLSGLTLGPGQYTLSVAGGAGAKIELTYLLK